MSTYKYNLQNFHAIEKAEITIEGITVLAGENGCGKSTLSKWLYYIVNEVYNFEQNLFKDYIKSLLLGTWACTVLSNTTMYHLRIKTF